MKLLQHKSIGRRAIAMTEYLIILAVVAIAAIVIVGIFGTQIKNVFSKSTSAMSGTTNTVTDQGANAATASTKRSGMNNFDK